MNIIFIMIICKQLVFENDFKSTSRDELVQRIKDFLKKGDVEVIKNMINRKYPKRYRKNHRSLIGSQPWFFCIFTLFLVGAVSLKETSPTITVGRVLVDAISLKEKSPTITVGSFFLSQLTISF